jgi:Fe-S cluster biogenesis protein NfuA
VDGLVPDPRDLHATSDRIEQLLDELQATADPRTCNRAEEVLRLVTDLYGAGLARVVELSAEVSPELIDVLAHDELVASLLMLHGLHPVSLEDRVREALARVRPFLAAHEGDVELLDIDADAGAVLIRLLGSCDGCPSASMTLQLAVERAITEAAPEIVRIDTDQPPPAPVSAPSVPSVPVALRSKAQAKPVYEECPAEMAEA